MCLVVVEVEVEVVVVVLVIVVLVVAAAATAVYCHIGYYCNSMSSGINILFLHDPRLQQQQEY